MTPNERGTSTQGRLLSLTSTARFFILVALSGATSCAGSATTPVRGSASIPASGSASYGYSTEAAGDLSATDSEAMPSAEVPGSAVMAPAAPSPVMAEEAAASTGRASHAARRAARRAERSRSAGGASDVTGGLSLDMNISSLSSRRPPPPPSPPPAPMVRQTPVLRALTAASVGDVDRRGPYLDYLGRHPAERAQIGLDMTRRVRFRVFDGQSRPVHDATISFVAGNHQVEGRTHADGYWDFFPGVSAPGVAGSTKATIRWRNQQVQVTVPIPPQGDSPTVTVQLPQAAAVAPSTLDLAFLIDVTGSMGDELAYVNAEVMGIVQRVRQAVNQVNVRVAATFYRDRGDRHPLQQIPFSSDVQAFNAQMASITADGGGDYPEDLNAGLGAALTTLEWTETPAVRVLVVISDAPPQQYPNTQYTYYHALNDAARQGIRILPVAASGADRVVEYLFRAMGTFTSTPYVYLTNDSGIGGHHMEADTDRIAVEMFSDLLTRLLIAELQGQGMHEPSHSQQSQLILGQ